MEALLYIAQTIEDENYYDDVTAEEQARLMMVVQGVRAAGHLLKLHVNDLERYEETLADMKAKRQLLPRPSAKKLKVVK
jgi:hypothetical protein